MPTRARPALRPLSLGQVRLHDVYRVEQPRPSSGPPAVAAPPPRNLLPPASPPTTPFVDPPVIGRSAIPRMAPARPTFRRLTRRRTT